VPTANRKVGRWEFVLGRVVWGVLLAVGYDFCYEFVVGRYKIPDTEGGGYLSTRDGSFGRRFAIAVVNFAGIELGHVFCSAGVVAVGLYDPEVSSPPTHSRHREDPLTTLSSTGLAAPLWLSNRHNLNPQLLGQILAPDHPPNTNSNLSLHPNSPPPSTLLRTSPHPLVLDKRPLPRPATPRHAAFLMVLRAPWHSRVLLLTTSRDTTRDTRVVGAHGQEHHVDQDGRTYLGCGMAELHTSLVLGRYVCRGDDGWK